MRSSSNDLAVRALTGAEKPGCEAILRALPDWFGIEEALADYVRDIAVMETFGAFESDVLIGFLTLRQHFPESAEVHVMGVRQERHRRGIGRALLTHAESWLREQGVRWLQVKTLGPSREDAGYARTRAFYQALGFDPLEECETRWPGNPCLTLVKRL